VPAYAFLSDDWLREVRRVVDEHGIEVPDGVDVTLNLVVTETPFEEDRRVHLAVQRGAAVWSAGQLADADLTLTTDYDTARAIFMTGDPQSALQAFMEGKVKIQGDLTKLMAAQASGVAPGSPGLASALTEITE
jgi:putative sterol carrier protein